MTPLEFRLLGAAAIVLGSILAALPASSATDSSGSPSPIGRWADPDGGVVEIDPCGAALCGRIVALASKEGVALHELPLQAMQAVEPKIAAEVLKVLSVESSVKSRTSYGGTAPKNVQAQAKAWLKRLEKQRKLG